MVTIFNIIFRIYIFYILIQNKHKNIYLYFLITELLDRLDGTLARMYDQHTEFGATIDHVSDKIFWSLMIIYLLHKHNKNKNITMFLLLLSIALLSMLYIKQIDCFNDNSLPISVGLAYLLLN